MSEDQKIIQLNITDLPINSIDGQSPIPLYHQITLDLRRLISESIIPPGALLPPEKDICLAYGVGRQTIRRAIARLVDENLVDRYAGRGTFVRDHIKRASFHLDRSFSQHIKDLGLEPHSKTLSQEISLISLNSPQQLHTRLGKTCLKIERVRYGDQIPICYQISTILTEDCVGLDQFDFNTESLYSVLAKDFGLIITRIDHLFRAIAADDYRADLLEVEAGSPLLSVITTAYLEDGEIIEMTFSHYRADHYQYRTSEQSTH